MKKIRIMITDADEIELLIPVDSNDDASYILLSKSVVDRLLANERKLEALEAHGLEEWPEYAAAVRCADELCERCSWISSEDEVTESLRT